MDDLPAIIFSVDLHQMKYDKAQIMLERALATSIVSVGIDHLAEQHNISGLDSGTILKSNIPRAGVAPPGREYNTMDIVYIKPINTSLL